MDAERTCRQCAGTLPAGCQKNRLYCSESCKQKAWYLSDLPLHRERAIRKQRALHARYRDARNAARRKDRSLNPDRYREHDRLKRLRHPEKIKARDRKRYLAKRDEHWAYNLRAKFGITADDYSRMLASQGGRCAICRTDKPAHRRFTRFMVDHDHDTGAVRGLLCSNCNKGIGCLRDNPATVAAAFHYLVAHKAIKEVA